MGEGNFEDLDIRFAPPYRSVIFVTTVKPVLPLDIKVETYNNQGFLQGEGSLHMTQLMYHNAT